jgi:hypothetical protein
VKARFYIWGIPDDFKVHVYDLGGNDLVQPFTVTPISTGWFDVPLNVEVSGDFIIALEWIDDDPKLGIDNSPNQGHSYFRSSSTEPWNPDSFNYMIRAVVCDIPPVGGELLPNNASTIGTLVIALISIIGISTGFALKKRRPI